MKTPLLNALSASIYIGVVVGVISFLTSIGHEKPDNILIPMFMLSLLVLSVAVMGFLFFYKPFELYFDNKRKEAVLFFWKTVGIFAIAVGIFLFFLVYIYFPG
jgi:membrane protease YdiL (CAAX protease family)